MKKYKLNYKKITRNIFILIFAIITIILIKNNINKTNEQMGKYNSFVEFAKSEGLEITENNYKNFIEKGGE